MKILSWGSKRTKVVKNWRIIFSETQKNSKQKTNCRGAIPAKGKSQFFLIKKR